MAMRAQLSSNEGAKKNVANVRFFCSAIAPFLPSFRTLNEEKYLARHVQRVQLLLPLFADGND